MNIDSQNASIIEIQNEYHKIEGRWLKLQYGTLVGSVLFGFLLECTLGFGLYFQGFITIPLLRYVLKYILAPFLINSALILIGVWAMHSSCLSQKAKIYIISLLCVGVCFIFFAVHSVFQALFIVFTAPILLTIVYGDYILTSITAFLCISAKILTELFVAWDPDKLHPFSSHMGKTNFVISIFLLGVFYAVCVIAIRFEKEKNSASIQKEIERLKIQRKLHTDDLTQIFNRTALRKAFESMETDQEGNSYTFAMIDMDNFKTLNDTFGHDIGDEYLKEFGSILRRHCMPGATPFRYGGDEFCIMFKNVPTEKVISACIKIQDDLLNSTCTHADFTLTASVGIACHEDNMTASQLLKNTDSALYRSKTLKDSICVFND